MSIDKAAELDSILKSISEDMSASDLKAAFVSLKKLSAFKPKKAQHMPLEDGSIATTPLEVRQRWLRHWVSTLDAVVMWFSEVLDEERWEFGSRWFEGGWDDLPSPDIIQNLFRTLKAGKAFGEDGLPPELFKLLPLHKTKIFYPLMLKSALTLREPVQWRGSEQKEIDKAKAKATAGVAAFRGVSIAEIPGKVFHKATRNKAEPPYREGVRDGACEGLRGRGSDFGFHMLSGARRLLAPSYCLAAIFLDVVGAFDNFSREVVFEGQDPVYQAHLGATRAAELLKSMFRHSWASVQGIAKVMKTTKSCKPGDSWADVAWGLPYTRLLNTLSERLKEEGIEFSINFKKDGPIFSDIATGLFDAQVPLADISFIDDVVLINSSQECHGAARKNSNSHGHHRSNFCGVSTRIEL